MHLPQTTGEDAVAVLGAGHGGMAMAAHLALTGHRVNLFSRGAERLCGVRHYVSRYMFNNPPETSAEMDIAKMLSKNEMIESLSGGDFFVFRQVRAGLAHFSSNPFFARGSSPPRQ